MQERVQRINSNSPLLVSVWAVLGCERWVCFLVKLCVRLKNIHERDVHSLHVEGTQHFHPLVDKHYTILGRVALYQPLAFFGVYIGSFQK